MKISHRKVFITGGASGIGFALAKEFMRRNNKVLICGRNPEKLRDANEKLPGLVVKSCDVTDLNDLANLVDWALQEQGGIDILINNAGIWQNLDMLKGAFSFDLIEREVQTNLLAPIFLTQRFFSHLLKREESAVVNVSSVLAYVPHAAAPVYSATKAGLHSFTMALRRQASGTSVKVFELFPPLTDTSLAKWFGLYKLSPEKVAAYTAFCMGRDRREIRPGLSRALYGMSRMLPNLTEQQLNRRMTLYDAARTGSRFL